MKKNLKIFIFVIVLMLFIPMISIKAENKKVKVYMFEAGGCPYCEEEEEYLKGLDSYDKKFELIKKELYVDHVEWKKGKDYDLGVKVANEFNEAGFENATYQGTPFVIISDLYATTSYNDSLEDIINEAYETGDKDIVGCYESGKSNCLDDLKKANAKNNNAKKDTTKKINLNYDIILIVLVVLCSCTIIVVYILKSNKDKKDLIDMINKTKKSSTKNK